MMDETTHLLSRIEDDIKHGEPYARQELEGFNAAGSIYSDIGNCPYPEDSDEWAAWTYGFFNRISLNHQRSV